MILTREKLEELENRSLAPYQNPVRKLKAAPIPKMKPHTEPAFQRDRDRVLLQLLLEG
jgi:hypothetical protein